VAWYPNAVRKPLPENNTEPRIDPTQIILHTAACRCGDSLFDDFNRAGNNLESHFYVRWDGTVEQYMDTERQADANYKANVRAISIETQDDGGPSKPWTQAQLDAIIHLNVWLLETHPKIGRVPAPAWDAPGFGYHVMFGAPGPWTPVAKSCPGKTRIGQFNIIVWFSVQIANERRDRTGDWERHWTPAPGLGKVDPNDPTIPQWYKMGFGSYDHWASVYRR
jgi:hypothetical protein